MYIVITGRCAGCLRWVVYSSYAIYDGNDQENHTLVGCNGTKRATNAGKPLFFIRYVLEYWHRLTEVAYKSLM